jgi:tRNA (guanine-N7-)-methyltransferase
MNAHQHQLLTSLPAPVSSVSIFHPDPWMKKRHVKRRLVTDTFVEELAQLLVPGTPVYVQTDVAELFEYMVEIFDGSKKYQLEPLEENPFPVPTDRESYVRRQGGDIYRIKMIVGESQQRAETSL